MRRTFLLIALAVPITETAPGNSGHSERARPAGTWCEFTANLCDVVSDRALSIHRRGLGADAAAGRTAHQPSY